MLFFITDCYSYFSRLNSRSVSILSLILYIGCYNNLHFDTPSENFPIVFYYINVTYGQMSKLIKHLVTYQTDVWPFACSEFGKDFRQKESFLCHVKQHHTIEGKDNKKYFWICRICGLEQNKCHGLLWCQSALAPKFRYNFGLSILSSLQYQLIGKLLECGSLQ